MNNGYNKVVKEFLISEAPNKPYQEEIESGVNNLWLKLENRFNSRMVVSSEKPAQLLSCFVKHSRAYCINHELCSGVFKFNAQMQVRDKEVLGEIQDWVKPEGGKVGRWHRRPHLKIKLLKHTSATEWHTWNCLFDPEGKLRRGWVSFESVNPDGKKPALQLGQGYFIGDSIDLTRQLLNDLGAQVQIAIEANSKTK